MKKRDPDRRRTRESLSSDKLRSFRSLVLGSRAAHFDALLPRVPTSSELTELSLRLDKPHIDHAIFDLDGTLVPPYSPVPDEAMDLLMGYRRHGRTLAIYTNSPHSDRLDILREHGIAVATTIYSKPSLLGFQSLCDQAHMDPYNTAMIGNFPITDMPLVEEGQPPFFPMNLLVDSIPPEKIPEISWRKYIRARLFHAINVASEAIVRMRNPNIVRHVSPTSFEF